MRLSAFDGTNCTFLFDASLTGWNQMGEVFRILTLQTARLGEKALKLVEQPGEGK